MVIFNWYDKFIGDLAVDTIKLSSLPDRFPTCGTQCWFSDNYLDPFASDNSDLDNSN